MGLVPAADAELRARAEQLVDARAGDADALAHELRVHQVELAMQNDELRRAQIALTAARDAYRDLYDHAPVGYLSLDDRGAIVQANQTAAAMLGVELGGLHAVALPSLTSRADADALYLHLCQVRDVGGHRSIDLEVRPAGGAPVRLRLDTIAAPATADGPAGFRTTLTDVTVHHQLKLALAAANRDLERRVDERTAELRATHDRLLAARKMEAVGRLAGGIAHDFNNLLTVITLEAARARAQGGADAGEDGPLVAIERTATLAAALTAKLLAFARRDTTMAQPCAAGAVVTDSAAMLRALLGDRITLTTTVDDSAGWVAIDRAGLQQILVNLVTNARDAITGSGHVTITVASEVLDAAGAAALRDGRPGPHVVVTVGDDGCGMAADVLTRVFEPFFTTKGRQLGTGFGLATVFGTVDHAAGFIDLQSQVGRGTQARIYLPRIAPQAAPAARGSALAAAVTARAVLLVDDDEAVRRATRRTLEIGGYRVIAVGGGEAALAALATGGDDIGLVLSDVIMPRMSGTELARAIEATGRVVPIVLMSGYLFDEAPPRWRCIQKPFTPRELLAMVGRALGAATASQLPPGRGSAMMAG